MSTPRLACLLPYSLLVLVMSVPAASAQEPAAPIASSLNSIRFEQDRPSNVPAGTRQAEQDIERAVRRFRLGAEGGIGLDPEIIMLGAHAAVGPFFNDNLDVRPGVELGLGEVTTLLSFNVDVFYVFPGVSRQTRWAPYVGVGPAFGLSHRGFETDEDDADNVDVDGVTDVDPDRNRFDFGDTDFNGGMNFIAGARNPRGLFFELRATAWGVSNIRLIAGFNF